jgi:glycosyltransferase involved in cell wall biosynthesis
MADIYLIGVRGIPNRYGGFERLIEVLAPFLAGQGHRVTVFCEVEAGQPTPIDDQWQGVHRRYIDTRTSGPFGTIEYDWRSFRAVPKGAIALIFGYGTGIFQRRLQRLGVRHAVNMDGIEWKRAKWGRAARVWLRWNERVAIRYADELIADHPEIQAYLLSAFDVPSTMIAYGVDDSALVPPEATPAHPLLSQYADGSYFLAVARPEPENQLHVLLEAYTNSSRRLPLVVIGNFDANAYGRALKQAHPEAHFAGGVYNAHALDALRRRSALYLHGHSVGGTNPSLIEAMAAGAWVVAHDNRFNRWVLQDGGMYFRDATSLRDLMDESGIDHRAHHVSNARRRCREAFLWRDILDAYSQVCFRLLNSQSAGT